MTQISGIFVASLGGAALVLGVAYGWTARDYRAQEVAALTEQVSQLEDSSSVFAEQAKQVTSLETQLAEVQAALVAAKEEIEAVKLAAQNPVADAETGSASEAEEVVASSDSPSLGDAASGEKIFGKCKSCHMVGAEASDRIGPHLNGIFGRRAGAHDGFKYSDDMAMMGADGLTWTLETLDAYLKNPKALVSRTRMNFAGLKDQQERDDILAYLRRFSDDPQNIPEAQPTAQAKEVELPPEVLALVGDPEYGEYLSSECKTCHQQDGSDEGIPSITFWPEEDFVIAMHAYKQKLRPHPVMQMMASRLSDEEIASLAAYFANLE